MRFKQYILTDLRVVKLKKTDESVETDRDISCSTEHGYTRNN